jgi:hypothetical protein
MVHRDGISDAMKTHDQEALHQFFAAYFHEDWPEEFTNPDEAISAYVAEGRRQDELEELATRIASYAGGCSDDKALERSLFADLGCYYVPSADRLTARDWLLHVAHRLRSG